MAYNTGNPLGSQDPRDLFDNAQILDVFTGTRELEEVADRFGRKTLTIHGMNQRAQVQIDGAKQARDDAIAAAAASGQFRPFQTYAEAVSKLATVPVDAVVEIFRDETKGQARTRYFKRAGNVLEFAVNLDQTRVDLKEPSGTQIVGHGSRTLAEKLDERLALPDVGGRTDGGDNTEALAQAKSRMTSGAVLQFPGGEGQDYAFTAALDPQALAGVVLDIDPASRIAVPSIDYLPPALRVTRPAMSYHSNSRDEYQLSPAVGAPPTEKAMWLGHGDKISGVHETINPSSGDLLYQSFGESVGVFVPAATNAKAFRYALPVDGVAYAGMRRMHVGDEISVNFTGQNNCQQVAIVKVQGGYYQITSSPGNVGGSELKVKPDEQAATRTGLDYPGFGTHASYAPSNSYYTLRKVTEKSFSLMLNGVEIIHSMETFGEIVSMGFGAVGAGAGAEITVDNWVLTRDAKQSGLGVLRIAVFGDSITDGHIYGNWPSFLQQFLDGACGARVVHIDNYARSGDTSSQQAALCTPERVAGHDVVAIMVGVNDSQAQSLTTLLASNVGGMIDVGLAAGARVVVGLPTMFYTRAESYPDKGQAAVNSEKGAAYRMTVMRVGAERGVKIFDTNKYLGPILSTWVNPDTGDHFGPYSGDPMVFDNIHPTLYGRMLLARGFAGAILSAIAQEPADSTSGALGAVLKNGWTAGSEGPAWRKSRQGEVRLGGVVVKGVVADMTVIAVLPEHLWPLRTHRFVSAIADGVGHCSLLLDTQGQLIVLGFPATGVTMLSLDNVSYQT